MNLTVADLLDVMETLAPRHLAADWDNVGLQIGDPRQPVRRLWIALDPLPEVVTAACRERVDLLITHHPLIFRPLSAIDVSTPLGAALQQALAHRLAVAAAHTNLDGAPGGINDYLALRLGLTRLSALCPSEGPARLRVTCRLPVPHVGAMLALLRCVVPPGCVVERCDPCSATLEPAADGVTTRDTNGRLRFTLSARDWRRVQTAVGTEWSGCAVRWEAWSLSRSDPFSGLGRVGYLPHAASLATLARDVKDRLELRRVFLAGDPDQPVTCVALCSGSGGSLVPDFLRSPAQVFVSGDLRYHDARTVEQAGRGLLDIGHFASEHLYMRVLRERLNEALRQRRADVRVEVCGMERDPFETV